VVYSDLNDSTTSQLHEASARLKLKTRSEPEEKQNSKLLIASVAYGITILSLT